MTIAMSETDKQVAEILEGLQGAAPEVIEQAIWMGQVGGGIGLVVSAMIAMIAAIVVALVVRDMNRDTYADYGVCGVIAGCVGIVALVACLAFGETWVKATYTPDYYAAQRIGSLIK